MSKNKLKNSYLAVLKSNQRSKKGFRFTMPSSSIYPYQWLWDSCFYAIIYCALKQYSHAKDEVRSLLSMQWKNGMVPHMIYWTKSKLHIINWGTTQNTSSITQPPMLAYAVEKIYKTTKDKNFVKETFAKLDNYYKWLHYDRADNYLIAIVNPWESGQDDIPTWDNIYHTENPSKEILLRFKMNILSKYIEDKLNAKKFLKRNIFNVKSVLFNSVYLRNLHSMLFLAKINNMKEAKYYQRLISKVKKSQRKYFYDKKTSLYLSLYNNIHFKNYENVNLFLPLFSGLLTKPEATKLVNKYLLNPDKFWAKYPVPTISIDDDNFQPNRYWRGSVWVNINWFIYKGLKNYKFNNTAKLIKNKTLNLVNKSGFREHYNPINGRGRGPDDFGWSGLIFDM